MPGLPYRPYFAFPDRLRSISDFKYCDAFSFSVFDPPHTLGPATAMVPDPTTTTPSTPTDAASPGSNVYTPAQITGSPGSPVQASSQKPFADPVAKTSVDPTIGIANPGLADPPAGSNTQPSKVWPSGPPQDPPQRSSPNPPEVDDQKTGGPNAVNKPAPTIPVINLPSTNLGPSDPNDESKAQMSALHQALGPSLIPGPQPQSTLEGPATNQFLDPHSTPEESPNLASVPSLNGPAPENQGAPITTIQLGPQPTSEPITLRIGSEANGFFATSAPGASINNILDVPASVRNPAVPFPVITAAGNVITVYNPSSISMAGGILTPGGPDLTLSGTSISLASNGNLVIGSAALKPSSAILTVAGHTFTANPTSFDIAGTPLKAGGPGVTISGTIISLGPSGNLVVGSAAETGAVRPTLMTAGGYTFTANPLGVDVAGYSLSIGGPGITVSGTRISLNPSGSLVIGTSTLPLATPEQSVFTEDGQIITIDKDGQVAVGGANLVNGGPATTLSGTPMRISAGMLLIGTNTIPLPLAALVTTINGHISTLEQQDPAITGSPTTVDAGIRANGTLLSSSIVSSVAANSSILPAISLTNSDSLSAPPSSTLSTASAIKTKKSAASHEGLAPWALLWGLSVAILMTIMY